MNRWTAQDARTLTAPEEVRVATRRADGSVRTPRIMWIVGDGDRVFIRSTNGRSADWFRWAIATGVGRLLVRGTPYDVTFREVDDDAELAVVDAAYRAKYARYASIVDHLVGDGPRAATLEVNPA